MKFSISIFKTFLLSLLMVAQVHFAYAQTASILPPAKTTFVDQNGKPLVKGTVDFYIPSTTTRKTTWQDAAETVPNANPVVLDAAGRGLILGSGTYRQIVKDRNGNVIWDQNTSSVGSGGGGTSGTGDGDLVGTVKPWAGMVAPNQYLFTYGQEISRATYAVLFTAITSPQSVFCNSGSPILSGVGDTTNFWVGMPVEVSCLAAGFSTIISKTSSSVTLAANANVTVSATATFFPWGRGNGTTTFNLPDFRGLALAGNNNMGGISSSNLTTALFGATNPNSSGAAGGSQSVTLTLPNLPAYTPLGTISGTANVNSASIVLKDGTAVQSLGSSGIGFGWTNSPVAGTLNSTGTVTAAFTGTAQGGTSTPFSIVQPTKTVNYIIKVTPDSLSSVSTGVTSLGSMVGDIACGTGLVCTGNNISATVPVQTLTVTTIASLKALAAPGVQTPAYVEGYTAASDGGEGWFEYNTTSTCTDNAGTCIIPNSAPGTGRWIRSRIANDGSAINVKWFGAKGDGATSDTTPVANALAVAIAAKGALYFPASTSCYLTSVTVPDSTSALRIYGDAMGYTGSFGSCLTATNSTATVDLVSVAGGNTNNIVVESLRITNLGTGDAVRVTNGGWITFRNLILFGSSSSTSHGLEIIGTGPFDVYDVVSYGSGGNSLWIRPSATTNSGPGNIVGGNFQNQGGTSAGCIVVGGQTFGVVFTGIWTACQGANMVASVIVDGDGIAATQAGTVTFVGGHGESNYNTANTGADFLIGVNAKAGTVSIIGWSGFGAGNSTNFQRDSVRIIAAQSVSVRDSNFTKLAATNGYSRSAIRLEATFPAAGDKYNFQNNFATTISGTMYSDANSPARLPTTFTGDAIYDAVAINNIFGTVTNNNSCVGCVGEYVEGTLATGSATALTTNTAKTITNISLSAGDWDIDCVSYINTAATTNITALVTSISGTTNTLDLTAGKFSQIAWAPFVPGALSISGGSIPNYRLSLAATTTVFLVAQSTFTVSTASAWGIIRARRVR